MADSSYHARKLAQRTRRIARARANLQARRVSLAPPEEGVAAGRANLALALSLSVATVCHVGVAYAAFTSHVDVPAPRKNLRVQVKLVEPPALREPAQVEAPAKAEVPARRAPEPKRVKEKAPAKAPEPTPAPAPAQPVAIVGLTLESTSSGGSGPGFAVGSTLSGATERTANTPRPAPEAPLAPPSPAATRNRRAEPRAAAGVHVEPARRLSRVQPTYPPLLERQGIEADVTVRVSLAATGRIENVELVRGASERAFDEAALAAARSEQFAPETHDGKPVATALTYTYRFRITP